MKAVGSCHLLRWLPPVLKLNLIEVTIGLFGLPHLCLFCSVFVVLFIGWVT